ncbi:hypothetical protein [Streptomyces sp. NPDC088785]|uniref:hypothetical protein n=1 Tax=Streptomyces sp. NPDC088785 TaxID=3365897 RepID=UPI0037F1543F
MPAQATAEWDNHGVAMLPMGGRLAAIRLPGDLVHLALDSSDREQIAATLAELLEGPAIHDTYSGSYYALIAWRDELVWRHETTAPCLATGHYVGIPRIDRTTPPGPHWVVAPRRDEDLCDLTAVAALVSAGRQRMPQD